MKEQTNLRLNYDNYFTLMCKTVNLLERICTAYIQYKKIKSGENLYIKALYGQRVIEFLAKAQLYFEMSEFQEKEYIPMLRNELRWNLEIAFTKLHTY